MANPETLLNMTVRDLIEQCKREGHKGQGYRHTMVNEFDEPEVVILIGRGPFARDLEEYYDIAAPGVVFTLGPNAGQQ